MPTSYSGEVAIILSDALAELELDKEFDPEMIKYLQSCYDAGTLGNERVLQRYLDALMEEAQR
jgi:hypothetical protein